MKTSLAFLTLLGLAAGAAFAQSHGMDHGTMHKPMAASPMGIPGCPEFAFSTASTARNLRVFTQSSSIFLVINPPDPCFAWVPRPFGKGGNR